MRRLVRTFAAAAIGFAAASLYRQWQDADRSGAKRPGDRHGRAVGTAGALTTSGGRETARRVESQIKKTPL